MYIVSYYICVFSLYSCCRARKKRRKELYFAQLAVVGDGSPEMSEKINNAYVSQDDLRIADEKQNGVLAIPMITVTKSEEKVVENGSASPQDVEISMFNSDSAGYASINNDMAGYASITHSNTSTMVTTTVTEAETSEKSASVSAISDNVDPLYAAVTLVPPPIPPKMEDEEDQVFDADQSSHHPDILLANIASTRSEDKRKLRISANGRVKEIPRPVVVPPGTEQNATTVKRVNYSNSLPRMRYEPVVHSYSPAYTLVTPSRHRRFVPVTGQSQSLRYVATSQRSPVFLVRNHGSQRGMVPVTAHGGIPVVRGNHDMTMSGMVLKTTTTRQHRYKRRSRPSSESSMTSERSKKSER